MGATTEIEWCVSTVNPAMGCRGCELYKPEEQINRCYAAQITQRMTRNGRVRGWPVNFGTPTVFQGRIEEACGWRSLAGVEKDGKPWIPRELPRLIFVGDMGDIFSDGLPDGWLEPLVPLMADAPHVWMLLTKRPSRMREFFRRVKCPDNFWLGTSLTGPQYNRVENLCAIDCKTVFLSVEPQWSDIDLPECFLERGESAMCIMGGESGDNARPYRLEFPAKLVGQCDARKVKPFVKQLGRFPVGKPCQKPCAAHDEGFACSCKVNGGFPVELKDSHGGRWEEWPDEWRELRRREFPRANMLIQPQLIGGS